jgi:sigma-B regulation protein RsbU (phosphoserine phosphatase)
MAEKILIVDDQAANRSLLSDFLTELNYQVCEAEDGNMAFNQALQQRPDLILMDIVMPNSSGYEACVRIKQETTTKDIPVIFLSSLAETKDKLKGFEAGGADYFIKFGDLSELQARVQAHLKIRSLTQSLVASNRELQEKQNALNEDLTSAAQIQRSLLPIKTPLSLPPLEIAWECLPCQYIGGDIFNYIRLDEEHVAFYMLDVCGHGVPSAMVAVSVSQHFHELISRNVDGAYSKLFFPGQLLKDLNQEFALSRFGRFFTAFYMVLNLRTGRLFHSLAGHPPAVLLRKERPYELLKSGGSVIGIDEIVPFAEDSRELKAGDKIVLYTDGVIEYENSKNEFFSMTNFLELLESIKHESAERIVQIVFETLNEFGNGEPPKDDISFICITYNPRNGD